MRYKVSGAHRDTGEDVDLRVVAATADEARTKANAMGVLASEVAPANQESTKPAKYGRRTAKTPARVLALIVSASGLAAAAGYVAGTHTRHFGPAITNSASAMQPTTTPSSPVHPPVAVATKAAWDGMERAEVELRALGQMNYIDRCRFVLRNYGTVDTDYADPDLAKFVRDWMGVHADMFRACEAYAARVHELQARIQKDSDFGATLGSMNRDNPQGTAAAGAAIFGAFSAASSKAEQDRADATFDAEMAPLGKRIEELEKQRQDLATRLRAKYDLPFNRKL